MSRIQPARRVAADVLAAVRESDAYANLLLPTRIRDARLTSADAGFATELVYGTLRMQGYYDRVIAVAARRATEKIDAPVLEALGRAVRLRPDRGDSIVRVHPDDLAVATAAVTTEPTGWPGDVQVVGDRSVEPGGCIVDVGECRIDAQIGTAIERLRSAWA